MIPINKYTYLSSHMAQMPIIDKSHIKQTMLIDLSSAMFMLYGEKCSTFFK